MLINLLSFTPSTWVGFSTSISSTFFRSQAAVFPETFAAGECKYVPARVVLLPSICLWKRAALFGSEVRLLERGFIDISSMQLLDTLLTCRAKSVSYGRSGGLTRTRSYPQWSQVPRARTTICGALGTSSLPVNCAMKCQAPPSETPAPVSDMWDYPGVSREGVKGKQVWDKDTN